MSQQFHTGLGIPIKRRRGRPRNADTIQTQIERPSLKQDDQMIGRTVAGVLEGAFDDGYFLAMRVSENQTYLKGLVFQPGKFVPITQENDIAPLATNYTRMDLIGLSSEISMLCDKMKNEERIAQEKLELLASLSVEMDLPKPLAKKVRIDEDVYLTENVSSEELKAATTLSEFEMLEAIKETANSSVCENNPMEIG